MVTSRLVGSLVHGGADCCNDLGWAGTLLALPSANARVLQHLRRAGFRNGGEQGAAERALCFLFTVRFQETNLGKRTIEYFIRTSQPREEK